MSIKRTLRSVMLAVVVGMFLVALAGCRSAGGAYFQTTRDDQAHVFRNRITNPNDTRFHERHATDIESQVADF